MAPSRRRGIVFAILMAGCNGEPPTAPRAAVTQFSGAASVFEAAASVIDQEQLFDASAPFTIAIGGQSDQKLAQVVTAGQTGNLTEVRLPIACSPGIDLLVQIQGVGVDGKPNGVVAASQVIAASSLPPPVPFAFRGLVFTTPPHLAAGDVFAIVLSATVLSRTEGCGIVPGPVGNPYPRGDGFFDALENLPRRWIPLDPLRSDLPFQTLVRSLIVVGIDIKPGGGANVINAMSRGRTPVAILSTPEFAAPFRVDRSSLTFGATGDEASLVRCVRARDVNGDGLADLVCLFATEAAAFDSGDDEGILRGETTGGVPIEGRDAVSVVR